jgi:uncharacterized protein
MHLRAGGGEMKTTVVWGPPACGKSSYIDANAGANCLIWDFDRVMRVLSNKKLYTRNENLIGLVADLRSWIVERAEQTGVDEAWFSATWVNDEFRKAFESLGPEYHLIEISQEECLKRLEQDDERADVADDMKGVIQSWYDTYKRGSEMKDVERRFLTVEVRAKEGDEMIVEGRAIVYDSETDLGYFRETVAKGASTEALSRCDAFLLFNHDPNQPLARIKNGTLTATEDEQGVTIRADLSKSAQGADVYKNVKSGLIDKMSFAFSIEQESWVHAEDRNQTDLRIITKFRDIYDFSPVTYPAYKATELQARSAEAIYNSHRTSTEEAETSMDVEPTIEPTLDAMKLRLSLIETGVSL